MNGRRLARAAGWVVGPAAIVWFFFGSIGAPDETEFALDPSPTQADVAADPSGSDAAEPLTSRASGDVPSGPLVDPPGATSPLGIATPLTGARGQAARRAVTYAIGLHDLQGLAPDASPGSRLQLWAAWDSPLVDEPRVQRLVDEVVLEKIIPPTLPEGPHVALLSLRPRHIPRLLYGTQWARLSVVMLEPHD